MPIRPRLLALSLALTLAPLAAAAERTEWTESGNTKTKTVYDQDGNLLYQATWSKETGQMLGEPLDLRRPKTSSKAAPRTGPRSSQPRATAAEGGTPPARSGPKLRFDRRAGGVFLRADSLVRVRFDDELHSGRHRRGRKFGYTLLEDVVHDGAVVLAKGSRGQGQVTGARRRGRFGRSGRLDLDFGGLPLPGGGQLRLGLTETSREANKQTAIAAGSSGAGLLVLGPIGLAGGLFVKGRDAYIKEGDVTWVSVLEDAQVR